MLLNLIVGTLVGLGSTSLLFGLHAAGLLRTDRGGQILLLAMVFHITGLIWALGRHRSRAGADGVPFTRLFGAGLMVSLVAGVVVATGSLIFMEAIDPTHLDWVEEQSRQHLATLELSGEELQVHEKRLSEITPMTYAMQGLMGTMMTGLFLSLTISAFLRIRVLKAPS